MGGAVSCVSASPTIEDNRMEDNTAGYGAGVYCEDAVPVIRDNTFTGNTAYSYGGAVLCLNCSPTITGNVMMSNTAGTEGGALYLNNADPVVDGNTIEGNAATYWNGGGIFLDYYSDPVISNNSITANTAGQHGGGIYCDWYSYPDIVDNTISGNTSVLQGGGIHCSESSPTLTDNVISGNAGQHGGGIYCEWMSSPDLIRNTITDNVASWGGGFYCYSQCSPNMVGNTFTKNTATGIGGNGAAIYCYTSCNLTVMNTIVWGDSALPGAGEIYHDGTSTVTITYSNVEGGWVGTGNIDADPQFVLPGKRDYRLFWQSPCIDSGHPDSVDVDGTRCDMGAHCFDQNDYLTLYLTPDTTRVQRGGQLGVTYTVVNRRSSAEQFWLLSQVLLPGGSTLDILGPDRYTVPAGYTGQAHFTHPIPMGTPIASYGYRSRVGMPPSTLYDEDRFTFRVTQ